MPRLTDGAATNQFTQMLHHFSRPSGLLTDTFADGVNVGCGSFRPPVDHMAPGIGIRGYGGQGLIDLVSDAGGEFTEDNHAVSVQQLLFQLPHLLTGCLEFSQILDNADELAATILPDFTNGQKHRKFAAIPSLPGHFPARADNSCFPGFGIPVQKPVMLTSIGFGHEQLDILTKYLLFVVAEHILRSPVESLNGAVVVNDDDGIDSRIHQRVKRNGGITFSGLVQYKVAF